MKMIIVKIIVVLVAIVAVLMVVAMFSKNKYTLQREIVINKPKADVFTFVRYNKNQPLFSKWLQLDPNTKINYTGAADGTPGAVLHFASNSNKTGTGEWEIKKVAEGERLDFQLRFLKPFAFVADGQFATDAVAANQTKLTWTYHSGMNWPMNVMLLFMNMEKVVGPDIEESMRNIKKQVEQH
jgi:hypothetical protein